MVADDPARGSLTSWLYRPYIDLTADAPEGNPQTKGLLFALASVEEEADYPRLHGLYPPSLRDSIIRQARLPEYELRDPLDLPEELRTPGWESLCRNLSDFPALPIEQRSRVLWLLHRMHLHHAILDHSSTGIVRKEPDPARNELLFMRGLARIALAEDGEIDFDTSDLEIVADARPTGQWAAIEASYILAALAAKKKADVAEVRIWLGLHLEHLEAPDLDKHTNAKLRSRYHRAYAFIPQLSGDAAGMTEEMDRAAEWAEAMSRDTAEEEAEANVLGSALWESRTKEALKLGDLDLAEERARRYVGFAPLDPHSRMNLGQVLIEQGRFDQAATAYREAAHYGPPATEVSWFMLGQCQEKLDDLQGARDAYLAALDIDPLGVASLEQLLDVARRLEDSVLAGWTRERIERLGSAEADELLPYQKYEGTLGSPAQSSA